MNENTINRIRKFTDDRDWDQFHSPSNLAKSICIEAAELLECFQWDDNYDIERVKELYTPLAVEGYGKLSEDKIRNIKYHLIITIALIARFCIEAGMSMETSYTISDIFINRLDVSTTEEELSQIHKEVFLEYAKRMQAVNSGNAYSKHILMCLDLIYDNIYSGIRVQELADKLGLSAQYLSKLFRQEVGVTISEYIMSRRIQAAENMLKYSDYSSIDIGNYLNFSSHSHFISAFRKHTGLTPKQYREEYFRAKWTSDHELV